MWRIARDSQVLDLNASYAYVLWCRDFAGTSVVATVNGEVVGFVTGYRRPKQPATLMVWQVAVDEQLRTGTSRRSRGRTSSSSTTAWRTPAWSRSPWRGPAGVRRCAGLHAGGQRRKSPPDS